MTFSEGEPLEVLKPDLMPAPPPEAAPRAPPASAPSEMVTLEAPAPSDGVSSRPPSQKRFQVFSLHSVELYRQPPLAQAPTLWSKPEKPKQHLLLKSLSKDSSFSSLESLPDLLGGRSASGQRSESESGIVSDTGDTETTTTSNSEGQGEGSPENQDRSPRRDASKQRRVRTEEKMEKMWRRDERRRHRKGGALQLLKGGETTKSCSEDHLFRTSSPLPSQASSLESILVLDEELFPSKELLPRSSSLESCLLPSQASDGEPGGSLGKPEGEPGQRSKNEGAEGGPSSEELSRRTLDLLKRLENIQTPLAASMTRSISDMTLQSSSRQRNHLPASPGRVPGSSQEEPAVREGSATASLTELSGAEDSSLGSDQAAILSRQHHLMVPNAGGNSNASSDRKRCHGNRRGGVDEADAASVSLLVNVSCTCTDEDEDDSDLLSSSTLTLTEEELGFQEEEERLSTASSGNEEEEEMDGSYVLGLGYLKTELQSLGRCPRLLSSKADSSLLDELQCGASLSSSTSSTQRSEQQSSPRGAADSVPESSTHSCNNLEKNQAEKQKNQRNVAQSYISCLVDDVENGNVEQSSSESKEEDDRLLREESSLVTKRGDALREGAYVFPRSAQVPADVPSCTSKPGSPGPELRPLVHKRSSSLVGQLKGELPCHSSSHPSPPSLSPLEDRRSHDALQHGGLPAAGRRAITIQERFKFSSVVMEETRREVREVEAALPPRGRQSCPPSCRGHLPGPAPPQKENVHEFVMEIIGMTSTALRSKGQAEEASQASRSAQDQGPPLTQIRDKVPAPRVATATLC